MAMSLAFVAVITPVQVGVGLRCRREGSGGLCNRFVFVRVVLLVIARSVFNKCSKKHSVVVVVVIVV